MSREQLIQELTKLEKRLQEIEPKEKVPQVPRSPREPLKTEIEFIFDVDVVVASGLDISETGVAFLVDEPLPVEMRFEHKGVKHHLKARLVRTQRLPERGFLMGLELQGEVSTPPLPPPPDEDSPTVIL